MPVARDLYPQKKAKKMYTIMAGDARLLMADLRPQMAFLSVCAPTRKFSFLIPECRKINIKDFKIFPAPEIKMPPF